MARLCARVPCGVHDILRIALGLVQIALLVLTVVRPTSGDLYQLPPYKPYRTHLPIGQQIAALIASSTTVVYMSAGDARLGPLCGAIVFVMTHVALANGVSWYHSAAGAILGTLAYAVEPAHRLRSTTVYGVLFCALVAWSMATAATGPHPAQLVALVVSAIAHGAASAPAPPPTGDTTQAFTHARTLLAIHAFASALAACFRAV